MKQWEKKHYDQLRSAVGEAELTEREERFLRWLAGNDAYTVENFCSLAAKIRDSKQ